jgi:hypothetical protein
MNKLFKMLLRKTSDGTEEEDALKSADLTCWVQNANDLYEQGKSYNYIISDLQTKGVSPSDIAIVMDLFQQMVGDEGIVKSNVEKIIRHEGNEWVLYSHEGKVLGRHPTKESAEGQEAAVQANKSQVKKGLSYDEWEEKVIEELAKLLDAPISDIQGIIMLQSFILDREWAKDTDPKKVAQLIERASIVHRSQKELSRDEWEEKVIEEVAKFFGISISDAQGIVMIQPFILQKEWVKDTDPEKVAQLIERAATIHRSQDETSTEKDIVDYLDKSFSDDSVITVAVVKEKIRKAFPEIKSDWSVGVLASLWIDRQRLNKAFPSLSSNITKNLTDVRVAEKLLTEEESIKTYLHLDGDDLSGNPQYIKEVSKLSRFGVGPDVMRILEDAGHHSLVKVLMSLGSPSPAIQKSSFNVTKNANDDERVAERLMADETRINNDLHIQGGDRSNDPQYIDRIKRINRSGINPNVMAILEDENYHSLVSVLMSLGAPRPANKVRRGGIDDDELWGKSQDVTNKSIEKSRIPERTIMIASLDEMDYIQMGVKQETPTSWIDSNGNVWPKSEYKFVEELKPVKKDDTTNKSIPNRTEQAKVLINVDHDLRVKLGFFDGKSMNDPRNWNEYKQELSERFVGNVSQETLSDLKDSGYNSLVLALKELGRISKSQDVTNKGIYNKTEQAQVLINLDYYLRIKFGFFEGKSIKDPKIWNEYKRKLGEMFVGNVSQETLSDLKDNGRDWLILALKELGRISKSQDNVTNNTEKDLKTSLGVQRHNNRMDNIWNDAKELERKRVAAGEEPNPSLTSPEEAAKYGWVPVKIDGYNRYQRKAQKSQDNVTNKSFEKGSRYTIVRRTFEAEKYPKGSAERAKLNENPLTSEYAHSYKYAVVDGSGESMEEFYSKTDAQNWIDAHTKNTTNKSFENPTAEGERLMIIDNEIWDKFGFRSGSDVDKNWNKYKQAVNEKVHGKVSKETWEDLEDNNYHSMIKALNELGKLEKSQIQKGSLSYGVEGEIQLEAENNFGPYSTRREVENNVKSAIRDMFNWVKDKDDLKKLKEVSNNPSKIKDIVDSICEDSDITKTEKSQVEKADDSNSLRAVNARKLYTAQQIHSKYAGKFVDFYPYYHDYWNDKTNRYETVYEVRGVSSKERENYRPAEDIGKSIEKARTIGAHWKGEIKRIMAQGKKQGIENINQMKDFVYDKLPQEAFDTWESAYSEIGNLVHEYWDSIPDSRPSYMKAQGDHFYFGERVDFIFGDNNRATGKIISLWRSRDRQALAIKSDETGKIYEYWSDDPKVIKLKKSQLKKGTFDSDIKEEEEGSEHYEDLANKYPEFSSEFNEMAQQELGHKKNLEEMKNKLDATETTKSRQDINDYIDDYYRGGDHHSEAEKITNILFDNPSLEKDLEKIGNEFDVSHYVESYLDRTYKKKSSSEIRKTTWDVTVEYADAKDGYKRKKQTFRLNIAGDPVYEWRDALSMKVGPLEFARFTDTHVVKYDMPFFGTRKSISNDEQDDTTEKATMYTGYKCKLCGEEFFPYTDQQLSSHLKNKHPQQYKELQDAEDNYEDLMLWDFFTKFKRLLKSQPLKVTDAEIRDFLGQNSDIHDVEKLINMVMQKFNFHRSGAIDQVWDFIEDVIPPERRHLYKSQLVSKAIDGFINKYEKSAVTDEIARQLRTLGWKGPIVSTGSNSVKVNNGLKGVTITYNEGSDLYDLVPYDATNGLKYGSRISDIYADDLVSTIDRLISQTSKSQVSKTIDNIFDKYETIQKPGASHSITNKGILESRIDRNGNIKHKWED